MGCRLSFAAAPLIVAGAAGSQPRSARKHLSVSTALLIMHTSNGNIHKNEQIKLYLRTNTATNKYISVSTALLIMHTSNGNIHKK